MGDSAALTSNACNGFMLPEEWTEGARSAGLFLGCERAEHASQQSLRTVVRLGLLC